MSGSHAHGHGEGGDPSTRRLAIAFAITASIVVAQAVGAWVTGSLALLTDTAHAITDMSGLLVALIAAFLMRRPPTARATWGFQRIEIIAAMGQATLLIVVGLYAAFEGIRRLFDPPEVRGGELLIFGIIGLVANLIAIAVLSSSRDANLNLRAAFLEVLNDALGSFGVIVAAIVIQTTGFMRADAIAGLFIAALIVPRAAMLFKEAFGVVMEFTPTGLDLDAVREHIMALDHVSDVHDVHASTVATGLPTISAHVVLGDKCFRDGHAIEVLETVQGCVREHFEVAVEHSTFQLETSAISNHERKDVLHA